MFIAQQVSLQLLHALRAPLEAIARHDRGLAVQGREAGASVHLNIGEGNRRVGKDRLHFFRIAAGSCDEIQRVLETALAWGYIGNELTVEPMRLADRELGLLWGLTHPKR